MNGMGKQTGRCLCGKPGWYDFANETFKLTGPEVIAMYPPKDQDPG